MIFLTIMAIALYFALPILFLGILIDRKTNWSGDRTVIALGALAFIELAFFCQLLYWSAH